MAITVYSTQSIHPRERLSYWLEVATKTLFKLEFRTSSGPSFTGALRAGALGSLGIAIVETDACEVDRTARHIARDDSEEFLLSLHCGGRAIWTQHGRRADNGTGSLVLLDTRRPFSVNAPTSPKTVNFMIPRRALEARMGTAATSMAHVLDARRPFAGLASGFLAMLAKRIDEFDGPTAPKLAEQAFDLVALALSVETDRSAVTLSSPKAVALLRLKAVIEAHLRDPELKPAAAAAATGISVRYANALLALEGTSVERHILSRRLEQCRRSFEDPGQAHRTIGDIAFSWGFSDLSHFSRRFKAEFGCSPSDYRIQRK
jgi:AraC-like DNA-binding protein